MALKNLNRVRIAEENSEVGLALSVLLSAAGYAVKTAYLDSVAIVEVEGVADVPLLGRTPELSARNLTQRLRERLQNPLITDDSSLDEETAILRKQRHNAVA